MSNVLLGAFTPPGMNYPPYVNLRVEDGDAVVSVRSGPASTWEVGSYASIRMSREDFAKLLAEVNANFAA